MIERRVEGTSELGEMIEIAPGLAGYEASPGSKAKGGLLLLHPWWGLNQSMREVADRFASDGFYVLAPDLFEGVVLDTVEAAEAHLEEVEGDPEDSKATLAKCNLALDAVLAAQQTTAAGVVGFSFGAGYAMWMTEARNEIEALVCFYAGVGYEVAKRPNGTSPRYLGHFAADDPYEEGDPAELAPFHSRLQAIDPLSGAHLYPGTKHWFFESDRPEFDLEASRVAYDRTVELLTESLGAGPS